MRAVLVETTEAMDHHGWKWWSKQTMNLEQLRIELIDIWHFALSQ
ncbi:dUTP diphosphatase, partial [Corallococcus sp. CA049B]